jgi:hypothetical protein
MNHAVRIKELRKRRYCLAAARSVVRSDVVRRQFQRQLTAIDMELDEMERQVLLPLNHKQSNDHAAPHERTG